jgi:hypothetical protein
MTKVSCPYKIFTCKCVGGKYCDKLHVIKFSEDMVEINVKHKGKIVGGVVVDPEELIKFIKTNGKAKRGKHTS